MDQETRDRVSVLLNSAYKQMVEASNLLAPNKLYQDFAVEVNNMAADLIVDWAAARYNEDRGGK